MKSMEIQSKEMMPLPPEELFGAVLRMLQDGYDAEFTVVGDSMWPFLANKRDTVTIRKAERCLLKKGAVVLLKTERGYLLHRITRFRRGMVQTTGDKNCYRDEPVPAENVLGQAVCFTRKGKRVSCNSILYRAFSFIWRVLFPLRPFLLRVLFWFRRRAS